MVDVLLDSSFLLPVLGYEVKGIESRDFENLRVASRSGKMRLYGSSVSFIEIFGKLAKKRNKSIDVLAVEEGIKSLLESGVYTWINPSAEALKMAYELRLNGHVDNIDNVLYGMAFSSKEKMYFLSLDLKLKNFLRKIGYDDTIIVAPKDLGSMGLWT